jgi:hypothetical protein
MCNECDRYRRFLKALDILTFAEQLEGDGFIGNGGHVMQPSADVYGAWDDGNGCEPWYNGMPGGWYTACDAMVDGDAPDGRSDEEAFGPYFDWLDDQGETLFCHKDSQTFSVMPKSNGDQGNRRREAVLATRRKLEQKGD